MKRCPVCARPFGKVRRCYVCSPAPQRVRTGTTIACLTCGTEIYVPSALQGRKRFCSRACKYRYRTLEYERTWLATFWSKVPKDLPPNQCWEWQGARFPDGYGVSSAPGVGLSKVAHRVSWFVHNGPIPDGMDVRHKVCDNPPCVNPAHLALGTQVDNNRDRLEHGHYQKWTKTRGITRGEDSGSARLTEAIVREMRELHAAGMTQVALAAKYSIHQSQVSNIVRRKQWAHI